MRCELTPAKKWAWKNQRTKGHNMYSRSFIRAGRGEGMRNTDSQIKHVFPWHIHTPLNRGPKPYLFTAAFWLVGVLERAAKRQQANEVREVNKWGWFPLMFQASGLNQGTILRAKYSTHQGKDPPTTVKSEPGRTHRSIPGIRRATGNWDSPTETAQSLSWILSHLCWSLSDYKWRE